MVEKQKMRIAIGYAEIAGVLKDYACGFEQAGHKVTSINMEHNRFYNYKYSLEVGSFFNKLFNKEQIKNKPLFKAVQILEFGLKRVLGFFIFFYLLPRHDIFLYQWTTLFNQKTEFRILKFFNKKIVAVFLGSDVRHISAFQQEFKGDQKTWELIFKQEKVNRKLRYLRVAELYCDVILSVPDQAGLAIRPYDHLQLIMDTNEIPGYALKDNLVPYIIHAPSAKGIKGTDKIVAVLDQLKAEGLNFNFKLLHHIPHEEVLAELKKADIVIDEINLNGPGKLGLESMAYCCALATRHLEGASPKFSPPLSNINPENLYEQLKKLISDRIYQSTLAKEGRIYVEQNNNSRKVIHDILIGVLNGRDPGKWDYTPKFFLDHYCLPAGQKISKSNLILTRKVLQKWNLGHHLDLDAAKRRGLL